MDLLDEESHRLLLWAVRLFEVGCTPTRKELRGLSEPRRPAAPSIVAGPLGSRRPTSPRVQSPRWSVAGCLEQIDDGHLAPTELGRVVVSALGLHPEDVPLFEVIDTDLASSDPLAFARVVGRISALDRPMVVDPYCRRPQLEYLVAHTSVTRVLVSDRLTPAELAELVSYTTSIRGREIKLRLRVAPANAIHDRHVLNGDAVLQVGGIDQRTVVATRC